MYSVLIDMRSNNLQTWSASLDRKNNRNIVQLS